MTHYFDANDFGSDLPENWEDICLILNTYAEAHPDEDSGDIWENYWNGTLGQRYYIEMEGDRFVLKTVDGHDVVLYGRLSSIGIEENDAEFTDKLDDYLWNELHIAPDQWEVA